MPYGAFDIADNTLDIGEQDGEVGVHISDRKIGSFSDKDNVAHFFSDKRDEIYHEKDNFNNYKYILKDYCDYFSYKDISSMFFDPLGVITTPITPPNYVNIEDYKILEQAVRMGREFAISTTINDRYISKGAYPDGAKIFATGMCYKKNGKQNRYIIPPTDFGPTPWNYSLRPNTAYFSNYQSRLYDFSFYNNPFTYDEITAIYLMALFIPGFSSILIYLNGTEYQLNDYGALRQKLLNTLFFAYIQNNNLTKSICVKPGYKIILYDKCGFRGCKQKFLGPCIINGGTIDGYKNYSLEMFTGSMKVLKCDIK